MIFQKNDKLTTINITFFVSIILLALFAFNIANKANYIMLLWVMLSLALFKEFKVPKSSEFIALAITFGLYLLTYCLCYDSTIQVISYYFVSPLFCYLFGYNIIRSNEDKRFYIIIYTIIWALFIHGMFTTIRHIESGSIDRNPVDFCTKQVIPATLHGFFFTMMVSLLFYLLFVEKGWFHRTLQMLATCFSIYATLHHASRTLLILIALAFTGAAIYHLSRIKDSRTKLKLILLIVFIITAAVVIYNADGFGLKSAYEESNMYERVNRRGYRSLSEDGRIERSIIVLKNAFYYPFGGMANEINRFAHNLWLDTIRTVGTIPAIFLIIYTAYVFFSLSKFLKRQDISYDKRIIMLSLYIGIYCNFFVEPVLEGYPLLFSLSCIFNGMVYSMTRMET